MHLSFLLITTYSILHLSSAVPTPVPDPNYPTWGSPVYYTTLSAALVAATLSFLWTLYTLYTRLTRPRMLSPGERIFHSLQFASERMDASPLTNLDELGEYTSMPSKMKTSKGPGAPPAVPPRQHVLHLMTGVANDKRKNSSSSQNNDVSGAADAGVAGTARKFSAYELGDTLLVNTAYAQSRVSNAPKPSTPSSPTPTAILYSGYSNVALLTPLFEKKLPRAIFPSLLAQNPPPKEQQALTRKKKKKTGSGRKGPSPEGPSTGGSRRKAAGGGSSKGSRRGSKGSKGSKGGRKGRPGAGGSGRAQGGKPPGSGSGRKAGGSGRKPGGSGRKPRPTPNPEQ